MCKIYGIVGGKGVTLGEEAPAPDSNDMTLFKHASLISCDLSLPVPVQDYIK